MGISTVFEEIEDEIIPVLKKLDDEQIRDFLRILRQNYPRVNAALSIEKEYDKSSDSNFETGYYAKKSCSKSSIELLREVLQGSESSSTNLICTKGGSRKFWNIKKQGTVTMVSYGAIGSSGVSDIKNHGTEDACKKFVESKVKEKLRKGYRKDDSNSSKKLIEMLDAIRPESSSSEEPKLTNSTVTTTTTKTTTPKKNKVKILTRTEVSRLTKAKAIEKFAELGISTEGFDTVASMKQKLNSYFAELQEEEEEEDENEEEEEENENKEKEEKSENKELSEELSKRKAEHLQDDDIPSSKHIKTTESLVTSNIPSDALLHIFQYLSGNELGTILKVSKTWNQILSENDSFWHKLFLRRWGQIAHPTKLSDKPWKTQYQAQHAKDAQLAKGATVDLDKAGDAVEFLYKKKIGKNKGVSIEIGSDVHYGPITVYTSAEAKKQYEQIKDFTLEEMLKLWTPEENNFPDVLGGMLCMKERMKDDLEYLSWHILGYKHFLQNVARRGRGYVQHYY